MSKTALFAAARAWDSRKVAELLREKPALLKSRDVRGRHALHECARRRWDGKRASALASIATTRALLKAGADVNVIQPIRDDGEIFPANALWYAVAWGRNLPLVKVLLKAGANPDHCLWAVVWAKDATMARLLLRAGARTDLVAHGETPLQYAVRLHRDTVARELRRAGASD